MRKKTGSFSWIWVVLLASVSCIPQKNVILFQGSQDKSIPDSLRYLTNQDYEYIIGPTDILSIQIDGIDNQSFEIFAPTNRVSGAGGGSGIGAYLRGTLVDKDGNIELPYIGKMKMAELTLDQAADTLLSRLSVFMADPSLINVNVKIMNFTVSVIGEVTNPGTFRAENEFITLTEILAQSNFTTFSNRKNIKLIRSDRQTRETTVYQFDVTKPYLIQPTILRLQPNDVIYVEPTRRKQLTTIGPVIGVVTTLINFTILIYNLSDRF